MKFKNLTDISGKVELKLYNTITGKVKIVRFSNVFCDAGKISIARRLRGITLINQGIITYCAVGTGTEPVLKTDTQLDQEHFRKLISVRSDVSNSAIFQTFYNTEEANGELKEAGLFGDDATLSADSGTLFARTGFNLTKSDVETLTIRWTVEIG